MKTCPPLSAVGAALVMRPEVVTRVWPAPWIVPPLQKKSSTVKTFVEATSSVPPLLMEKSAVQAMFWVTSTLPVPRIVITPGEPFNVPPLMVKVPLAKWMFALLPTVSEPPVMEPPLLTMIVPPALFEVIEPSFLRTTSKRVPPAPPVLEIDPPVMLLNVLTPDAADGAVAGDDEGRAGVVVPDRAAGEVESERAGVVRDGAVVMEGAGVQEWPCR